MKRLYTLSLLLTFSNLLFSQLSVRNSAYVFVNDQVIFVEDDVNLNETDSRLYLRSEGQLIQGSGTSGNSGVGELSVYQNGSVDEYEYNYWCSPLGNKTNTTTNNTFGISLLNDVTGLTTSTPATSNHSSDYNGTSSPLNIEPYWIWKFIASDEYAEWIHVLNNTTINPGEGFTMKGTSGSGANQLYDFRGKPNTGTMAVNVLNGQFTLVGNPYPSAMDALEYIHDTENSAVITGTLYYWEQDPSVNSHYLRDYDGGYATYTISSGGVPSYTPATFSTYNNDGTINGSGSGSPSGKEPRRYIPIGQGFMVEGIATGTVKAKNAHRLYIKESNADSEFFKSSNTKMSKSNKTNHGFNVVPNDFKRFRLNIDFNNSYTRQLLKNFHATATPGYDYGLESKINNNDILTSDAYFTFDNEAYLVQALPFDPTLKIPLVIKLDQNMTVRIRITDIQNFDHDQPIFIHDIENNTYVNLKNNHFDMNLEAGTYKDRFEVSFNSNALNVADHTFDNFDILHNNNTSELKLLNPNALNIEAFHLFDISGKEVMADHISSTTTSYKYTTKSLSTGVYIARVRMSNNHGFSKKIVVNNNK